MGGRRTGKTRRLDGRKSVLTRGPGPARRIGNQRGRAAAPSPSGLGSKPGARTILEPHRGGDAEHGPRLGLGKGKMEDTGKFEARYLAFLKTISPLRPRLHRYCARMTGSITDGEDVVQDALLRAYRGLETWD